LAGDLPLIEADLRACDVPFQRLPVPFAFHSRFVDAAEAEWRSAFAHLGRETAFWPTWSCCTGDVTGPAAPDLPWRIAREKMNVQQTLRTLEQRGGAVYVDLSPSGTLAALFRQSISKDSPSRLLSILSPFGGTMPRLHKTLDALRPAPV
jgi:acyl transferase domain-containing protein